MPKKTSEKPYFTATGSRKRAHAKIKLQAGGGKVKINGKDFFEDSQIYQIVTSPLKLVGLEKKFDLEAKVLGGGITSRPQAVRLAVARALLESDEKLKQTLRKAGYLTRDPREKERKKPGLKRARKAPQWQKR